MKITPLLHSYTPGQVSRRLGYHRLALGSLLSLDLLSQFVAGRLPLGVNPVLASLVLYHLAIEQMSISQL